MRNSEDTCVLCETNKAIVTGSHMTPNCLLKKTIGDRENYVAYSIESASANIDVSYGSASNPTTERSINPHTYDYILCKDCEDFFGVLESEICPFLNQKIHNEKYNSNFTIIKLENEVLLKNVKRVNSGILNLFIYSVVWRICLQQKLVGASSIGNGFENMLSSTLREYVTTSIKELKEKNIKIPNPFILVTSKDYNEIDGSLINTNHDPSNPELIYVGNFIVLMYNGNDNKTISISSIPICAFNNSCICDDNTSRIVFLTSEQWKSVNMNFFKRESQIFIKHAVEKYAKKKWLPYWFAKMCLNSRAKKLSQSLNISFAQAVSELVK